MRGVGDTLHGDSCNFELHLMAEGLILTLRAADYPMTDDHGLASRLCGTQGMVHRRNPPALVAAQHLAVRDIAVFWLPVRVDLEELVHQRFESEGE